MSSDKRIFTSYENTRTAARDIYESSPDIKGLTLRPWNRFNPENTLWWIVPTTEWPAYTFGKVVISRDPKGGFFFGIVVEKGLDPEVGAAYPGKRGRKLIISDSWSWQKFYPDIINGKLEKAMEEINAKTSTPVSVRIDSAVINDPDIFDPYESSAPRDSGMWEYQKGKWKTINQLEGILLFLSGVASPKDLGEKINENAEAGWFWMDFYVGVTLPNIRGEGKQVWNGYKIWQGILYPLIRWLR